MTADGPIQGRKTADAGAATDNNRGRVANSIYRFPVFVPNCIVMKVA
jgi:hypothetical protein